MYTELLFSMLANVVVNVLLIFQLSKSTYIP
jgi:hypothetical protein